ncbi:MAG: hypothetical protein IJA80_06810 [Clostridia bacterium]|nr:hypothetical protein [Clostridia bacterium]
MAKTKAPLTPEQAEVKAMKKEKNSQGFIKFVAVLLALVLTVGVVFVGKTTADKALEAAGNNVVVDGNAPSGDVNAPADDTNVPSDDTADAPADDTGDVPADDTADAPAGDDATTDAPAGDNAPAGFSKANAHEMLNKWTAAATKKNYKFARVSAYTPDGAIDVGNATGTLNKVINMIDKNASLDSVVGGFLGIGNRDGEVKGGKIPEGMNEQYALKTMALTAADVKSATANGNKYTVVINDCSNPQKDGKNALSRATNDFFTHQEVVDGLAETAGSLIKVNSTDVKYTSITITATVDGDALKTLNISYTFSANLSLKALGVGINGKGKATNSITYTIG